MGTCRLHKELLIILLLSALGIRLYGLDAQPLWWDEGYSLYASSMPIGSMIVETAEDIHPPLYYAVLHVWEMLAGTTPVSVRLLSAFIGVLIVLLVFTVLRRQGAPKLAWLAGTLVAVNPFLVYYSQEVRMYALTTLLALISTCLMFLWLEDRVDQPRKSSVGVLFAYLAITAATLYTHYYTMFIVLAQTIFVLIAYRAHSLRKRWLIGQGVLGILYLPWVVFTATRLAAYVGGKVSIEQSHPLGPFDFLGRHLAAFAVGHLPSEWGDLYWSGLLCLALAVLGVVKGRQLVGRKAEWVYWPILVLTSLLGAFIINLVYPFNPRGFERLVLFAAPAYCILVAAGCLYLWQKQRVVGGLIVVVLIAVSGVTLWTFYATPRYADDDYRPLIDRVNRSAWSADAVLCLYPWQIGYFESYYNGQTPHLKSAFKQDWPARQSDPHLLPTYLDKLMAEYSRVWFPAHQTGGRILETELAAYLATNYYTAVSAWANPHTRLFLFSAPELLSESNASYNFANRIRLSGHAVAQEPVPSDGGVVVVELDWQRISDLEEPCYVGLRLVDSTDYTWAERSAEPVGGLRPFSEWLPDEIVYDRHGLLLTADTPPGEYHVKAGIYRRSDGRGLDVLNSEGFPAGVEADLGTVQITLPPQEPALARIPIAFPAESDFIGADGETVRFLGHSLAGTDYTPGDVVELVLFWQPMTILSQDAAVRLQLTGAAGEIIVSQTKPVVFGLYPMEQWKAGYPVRDPQRIIIPPETPAGDYTIRIGLSREETGQPLTHRATGQDLADLRQIAVSGGRAHDFTSPQVPNTLKAIWGDSIQLLGYGPLADSYAPGETLSLPLYWKALAPMNTSYTVFVHLLDEQQRIRGQVDSVPGAGTLPTTSWVPDEYLQDNYSFSIQEDAPAGTYHLEIGVYDATSGDRLSVQLEGKPDSADHVLIPVDIDVIPKQERPDVDNSP